jgi:hypothetical protein
VRPCMRALAGGGGLGRDRPIQGPGCCTRMLVATRRKFSVGPRAWRCGAPTTSRPPTALPDELLAVSSTTENRS